MTTTSAVSAERHKRKLPRFYFRSALINLAALLAALSATALIVAVSHTNWFYPLVFLLATSWYAASAHALAASGHKEIDAVVVSEQIIACGIASLIGHVAYAVVSTGAAMSNLGELPIGRVLGAANIFAEGLACAAIAPLVAMVLRFLQNPAAQFDEELNHIAETAVALNDFSRKATTVTRKLERLANAIDQSTNGYDSAVGGVVQAMNHLEGQLKSQSEAVANQLGELDAKTKALGDSMSRTAAELRRVTGDVGSVYTSTDEAVRGLSSSVDELSRKMRENSDLLDGLKGLIESVNDFVRPSPSGIAGEGVRES